MYKRVLIVLVLVSVLFLTYENVLAEGGVSIAEETDCTTVFTDEFIDFLVDNVFIPIKIAVPAILLVTTTIDFSKVVFSNTKDGMEKAKSNFIKRSIVAIIIFFIPEILTFAFEIIGDSQMKACLEKFN